MRPARSSLIALGLLGACGAAQLLSWLSLEFYALLAGLIFALASLDALRLKRTPTPLLTRSEVSVMALGVPRDLEMRVLNLARRTLDLQIFDGYPGAWTARGMPARIKLEVNKSATANYSLTSNARGHFVLADAEIKIRSPWQFWTSLRRVDCARAVKVYPNFAPLAKLAMVGLEQASRSLGAHLKRRRGEGTDFHQLRDYRSGDSLRQIDWKATQRVRRLISRDYTDERNQRVLLLLDCGRRMLAHDGALQHFDHALNAALALGYIVLRQGDSLGFLSSEDPPRWIPPSSGRATLDRILNGVFDTHASTAVTDFIEFAQTLLARYTRRSLVVILTNVRDEDIDDLLLAVGQLKTRHLVCVASLREAVLDAALAHRPETIDAALLASATAQYLTHRNHAHAQLRAAHAHVLDVTCTELAPALVNHYLNLKRSGSL